MNFFINSLLTRTCARVSKIQRQFIYLFIALIEVKFLKIEIQYHENYITDKFRIYEIIGIYPVYRNSITLHRYTVRCMEWYFMCRNVVSCIEMLLHVSKC